MLTIIYFAVALLVKIHFKFYFIRNVGFNELAITIVIDYISEFVLAYSGDVDETALFNRSGVALNENARETRRVRA